MISLHILACFIDTFSDNMLIPICCQFDVFLRRMTYQPRDTFALPITTNKICTTSNYFVGWFLVCTYILTLVNVVHSSIYLFALM